MKKLLKSEICGSVNSAQITVHSGKSTFAIIVHATVHEQLHEQ